MMYNMAAAVTVPARSSVVNRLPGRAKGCPHPSNLNHRPTALAATLSLSAAAEKPILMLACGASRCYAAVKQVENSNQFQAFKN